MVFHARWISHHSSSNPTLVATRLGRDSETRGEKNPSHMENHTKCISTFLLQPGSVVTFSGPGTFKITNYMLVCPVILYPDSIQGAYRLPEPGTYIN